GADAVRRNGAAVTAVGGGCAIFGALPGKKLLRTHEPGDAIAPARTAQDMGQARTAIGLAAAGELLFDSRAQAAVFHRAASRLSQALFPGIVAAALDKQRLAKPRYFVLAAHGFDAGIPLCGASQRMPSDFFKTSRCSRSLSFSARRRRISASISGTLRRGPGSPAEAPAA